MGKTTLINNVDFDVQVRQGSSNMYRLLKVLKAGKTMTIKADPNLTYRMYELTVLPDNQKLPPLGSTDIDELSAIEIYRDDKTHEFAWRKFQEKAENKSSLLDTILGMFPRKAGARAESSNSPTATP